MVDKVGGVHRLSSFQWLKTHHAIKSRVRQRTIDALGLRPDEAILDAGCGPGFWTELIAQRLGSTGCVVGVDVDPALLDKARLRIAESPVAHRIDFIEGNLRTLVLDRPFDRIVMFNCLPYFDNPVDVLSTIRTHLRASGLLHLKEADMGAFFVDPIPPDLFYRVMAAAALGDSAADAELDYDCFFGRRLPMYLRQAGAEDVTVDPVSMHFAHPLTPAERYYIQKNMDILISFAKPHAERDDVDQWNRHFCNDSDVWDDPNFVFVMTEIVATARF